MIFMKKGVVLFSVAFVFAFSFILFALSFVLATDICLSSWQSGTCSNLNCNSVPPHQSFGPCPAGKFNCDGYGDCGDTWGPDASCGVADCQRQWWYKDSDNDGYYFESLERICSWNEEPCGKPGQDWYISRAGGGDCDDNNANVHPGANEVCNSIDDDCDTLVDEGNVCCSNVCPNSNTINCGVEFFNTCGGSCGYGTKATCISPLVCDTNSPINGCVMPYATFSNLHWENLLGNAITQAQLGDSVNMKADIIYDPAIYTGMAFDVYNKSGFFAFIENDSSTSLGWPNYTTSRKILLNNGIGDYYFLAVLRTYLSNNNPNQQKFARSSNITVSSTSSNSAPKAQILMPLANSNLSTSVSFTQNSSDADDILNLTWDFGDGNITKITGYSFLNKAAGDINHIYSAPGVYEVILTAQEATRGQISIDKVSIKVFQSGINVFPIITTPTNLGHYVGGSWLTFNASRSFVANCSASSSCSDILPGNLKCCYIHAPNQASITGNYDLVMNWTINRGNSQVYSQFGNWSSGFSNAVFSQLLSSPLIPGVYSVKLNMTYVKR
jgi:PKD repeat protein